MRRARREVIEQVVYYLFISTIVSLLVAFPFGMFLMLGIGGVHSWWPEQVASIDYWSAYWISVVLLVISSVRPPKLRAA